MFSSVSSLDLLEGKVTFSYLKMSVIKNDLTIWRDGDDFNVVNGSLAADAVSPAGQLVQAFMYGVNSH